MKNEDQIQNGNFKTKGMSEKKNQERLKRPNINKN